jgi:Fe-S-cluster containining protein
MSEPAPSSTCTSCGACCACDPEWPRITLESEAEIAAIPIALLSENQSTMLWTGSRCAALDGVVGMATRCTVYAARPIVCRDCQPGDDACNIARDLHGLPPLPG